MSAIGVGAMVFLVLCAAAAAGAFLRARLPEHHLNSDSRDAIKLATAVVGTLSALALGFLIASAKMKFDDADAEMRTTVARIVLLDRVMAHYGPETEKARHLLEVLVTERLRTPEGDAINPTREYGQSGVEPVQEELRALVPATQSQRLLQTRAIDISGQIAEAHWLLVEKGTEGLPGAFLTILIFWLGLLFFTFGMLAPVNGTVVAILAICALSVSAAVFLIIDMAHPYLGLIRVSDEPLRTALAYLGQH